MKIKSILLFVISFFAVTSVSVQNWKYVDATDLTIVGKLFPDTPNPYHRIDTDIYGGFDPVEFAQVKMSSGIAVFGSSYTQGYGTSRPGMCYPSQLMRMTGLQFLNLGCSGHSTLQKYFAEALADAPVDAYLFDGFSNPSAEIIEERLFTFIETIQAKNPGKPLIFMKTIYREWRNFNSDVDRKETEKEEMARTMMKAAMRKYKDVYFITTTNATSPSHETSVDGTHPGDYGYTLFAESVREPLLKILAKYGIK